MDETHDTPQAEAPMPLPDHIFAMLVADRMKTDGLSRDEAMRDCIAEYPIVHQRWLREQRETNTEKETC